MNQYTMATLAEIHALGWTVSDHLLNQLLMNQITRPTQVFDSDRITDVGGTYSSGSTLNYVAHVSYASGPAVSGKLLGRNRSRFKWFPSPTGYMLHTFRFPFINVRYIP